MRVDFVYAWIPADLDFAPQLITRYSTSYQTVMYHSAASYLPCCSRFLFKSECIKSLHLVNPLECKGNYSATSNNMELAHWPLTGGLLHLVQRGGDWGPQPAQASPRCTECISPSINGQCTSHRIAPLLCGFNVRIKGLTQNYQQNTYACVATFQWSIHFCAKRYSLHYNAVN